MPVIAYAALSTIRAWGNSTVDVEKTVVLRAREFQNQNNTEDVLANADSAEV